MRAENEGTMTDTVTDLTEQRARDMVGSSSQITLSWRMPDRLEMPAA